MSILIACGLFFNGRVFEIVLCGFFTGPVAATGTLQWESTIRYSREYRYVHLIIDITHLCAINEECESRRFYGSNSTIQMSIRSNRRSGTLCILYVYTRLHMIRVY